MMEVKRLMVFETNSSSTHALAIAGDTSKNELPIKDGKIITDFGSYGDYDMHMTIFDQASKLSYLATECYYLNGCDCDLSNCYEWGRICDAICEHTGADGVVLLGNESPELNHQAIPEYFPKFCNVYDNNSIINFIFNPNIGINMGHD